MRWAGGQSLACRSPRRRHSSAVLEISRHDRRAPPSAIPPNQASQALDMSRRHSLHHHPPSHSHQHHNAGLLPIPSQSSPFSAFGHAPPAERPAPANQRRPLTRMPRPQPLQTPRHNAARVPPSVRLSPSPSARGRHQNATGTPWKAPRNEENPKTASMNKSPPSAAR